MDQNIYIFPNNDILVSLLWINPLPTSFKFNLSTFSLYALRIIKWFSWPWPVVASKYDFTSRKKLKDLSLEAFVARNTNINLNNSIAWQICTFSYVLICFTTSSNDRKCFSWTWRHAVENCSSCWGSCSRWNSEKLLKTVSSSYASLSFLAHFNNRFCDIK